MRARLQTACYWALLGFACWFWFQRHDLAGALLLLLFAQLVAITFVLIDIRDSNRRRHRS